MKITDRGGLHGYDGGKKINGRKRHIITDTEGLLIKVKITEANLGDRQGLICLLESLHGKFTKLKKIFADMGYRGSRFCQQVKNDFKKSIEIVTRPRKYYWVPSDVVDIDEYLRSLGHIATDGFQVQPKRWIVERTFAWLGKYRRLSKDFEFKVDFSEGLIYLAMVKNMLKNLTKIMV